MKVVLDRWAWLEKEEMTHPQLMALEKELTLEITKPPDYVEEGEDPTTILKLYEQGTNGRIGIPRQFFFNRSRKENEVVDNMSDGHPISVEFKGKLDGDYAEQGEALEAFLAKIRGGGLGGVLKAAPAWGKTAWALSLAASLGRTTLVVVNREYLLNQWRERIEKFLPGAKVGIIRQEKQEIEGSDICLGLVQSLTQREYPEELYRWPGLIVYDEVHRVPAETWSAVPPKFPARYRVGLSATPRRKDGADPVIWYHLGKIVYSAKKDTLKPRLRRIFTSWILPPVLRKKKIKMPTILRLMCANDGRNTQIAEQIVAAVRSPVKRKIMVLSDRIKHLTRLEDRISDLVGHEDDSVISTDYYVGALEEDVEVEDKETGKKKWKTRKKRRTMDELKQAERAQVIMATYQMAQEALDIPALDTVMLVTPRVDVEQAVGRIRRLCRPDPEKCEHYCPWRAGECQGKPEPVIVTDFIDEEGECVDRAIKRMRFYEEIDAI